MLCCRAYISFHGHHDGATIAALACAESRMTACHILSLALSKGSSPPLHSTPLQHIQREFTSKLGQVQEL